MARKRKPRKVSPKEIRSQFKAISVEKFASKVLKRMPQSAIVKADRQATQMKKTVAGHKTIRKINVLVDRGFRLNPKTQSAFTALSSHMSDIAVEAARGKQSRTKRLTKSKNQKVK
jgi:hypothetical protein